MVIGLPNEIRVYTTTIRRAVGIYTLMHNPLYRLNVAIVSTHISARPSDF